MPAAAIAKTQPIDGNNVKRSVFRVIGLSIVTSGLYYLYWFFVTKNQLKRELKTEQHVGWQTVGLCVPILNLFIHYWLYRDINNARGTQKLAPFPAVWYVIIPTILIVLAFIIGVGSILSIIGAIASEISDQSASTGLAGAGVLGGLFALLLLFTGAVLQYVFIGLAIKNLNEFWDKRTGKKAEAAKFRGGEVAIIVVGVLVTITNYSGNYSADTNDDVDLNLDDLSTPAALETSSPAADSSSSIDY